jgi:hypothetical protein
MNATLPGLRRRGATGTGGRHRTVVTFWRQDWRVYVIGPALWFECRFLPLLPSIPFYFSDKHRRPRPPALQKSWSAPLAGKPSTRGLFGLPEGTGAAPITGAPAAHCFKLLRHGLENLAGSDQKHHEYVLVLDWTVAGQFAERDIGLLINSCKLLIGQGVNLFSTSVTGLGGMSGG